MKYINYTMLLKWLVFFPILLPTAIITGIGEGIAKAIKLAFDDIYVETL